MVKMWVDVAYVAVYAGLSVATVYRAVQDGALRAVRVNGRRALRFRLAWVDEWLEGRTGPANDAV